MPTATIKQALIFAVTVALAIGVASPLYLSLAKHQAGTTYTGGHNKNGNVSLVVSADGAAVQSFQANGIPVDEFECPGEVVNVSFSNIPVDEFADFHFFSHSELVDGVAIDVSGDFDIPGFVSGPILIEKPGSDCLSIVLYAAAVEGGAAGITGDVDCDGAVDIGDAQKIARSLIDLPVIQAEPCPDIGS